MWYFVKIYISMHSNDNPSLNPQTAESIYWEVPSIRNLPFFLLEYYALLNYQCFITKTFKVQFHSNTNQKLILNVKIRHIVFLLRLQKDFECSFSFNFILFLFAHFLLQGYSISLRISTSQSAKI